MMKILQTVISMLSVPSRDLFDIVFSLLLSVVIAIIISQIYKYTHRGLSYELTFMATLVLLAPIVAVVMLYIRGDLVLSLGLIGSLSIIRFRTPIKDTRDMVFIFWIIAVGLGCGTYNWVVVLISTIIITVLMFIMHTIRYGQSYKTDYVLVVSGTGNHRTGEINEIIKKYAKEVKIRSKEIEDDYWETIFEVRFDKKALESTDDLLDELRSKKDINKVSLLAPQVALPV